jgi:arylsulfatase A-like enzyme
LKGESPAPSPAVFSEKKARSADSWRLVREGNFKFAAGYGEDGQLIPISLFDLAKDPYEMHNLVQDPTHQEIKEKLFQKLMDWHSGRPVRTLRGL